MDLRACQRKELEINGQPILDCLSGREHLWVLPTIKEAFRGKYVGIRERIIKEAMMANRRLVIRVDNPSVEFVISPNEFAKKAMKIEQKSKFSGYYTIYMYNIIQELRKSKQAVLV